MSEIIENLIYLIAQQGATPSGGGSETPSNNDGGIFGNMMLFLPAILGIFLVYMLLAGRPQQKQQAKTQEFIDSIKRNDRVLTAGGILGTVVSKEDEYITIRVDDSTKTKLQVLNTSIVRVVKDKEETANSS
ncbi:MAG TPA: preprotein translocase subunit YajC [Pirellulaceae bacterium]|mgnify:CR=1 FL=1|nr:preprotein translocase subunit YajC [Pirellulaceae bacterium]HMO91689.1 preprotein translocase subunit YajC [Pirellulaceae bacterium]HMP68386.1 preprotein translocase subunit YajC [Pirellulaceae bacterium]